MSPRAPQGFFERMEPHTQVKLDLLRKYIKRWIRIILLGQPKSSPSHRARCLIIDGFAGKGEYENGLHGSPVILVDEAIDFCNQAKEKGWEQHTIYVLLIERAADNYAALKSCLLDRYGLHVASGKFVPLPDYPSVMVSCVKDTFAGSLGGILRQAGSLCPSICFIDPFGFTQTPFAVIQQYLDNPKAEIMLTLTYEHLNRFIGKSDDTLRESVSQFFGFFRPVEMEDLVSRLSRATSDDRKRIIVETYSSQITHLTKAKHVLSFDIQENRRTKLVMFFATQHPKGFDVMKEVMWDVDETGSFMYNADKVGDRQIQFEFVRLLNEKEHTERLAASIYSEFRGRKGITREDIQQFVGLSTIYPAGQLKRINAALTTLEESGKLFVTSAAAHETRRRKGSFNKVAMDFA